MHVIAEKVKKQMLKEQLETFFNRNFKGNRKMEKLSSYKWARDEE